MSDASSIASSEITEESDYEDYFDVSIGLSLSLSLSLSPLLSLTFISIIIQDYEDVVEEDIVSPLLEKDIEIMERLYGKSSVESRYVDKVRSVVTHCPIQHNVMTVLTSIMIQRLLCH